LTNSTRVPARANSSNQQGLIGELAGQPVGRVAQHHIDADPGDHVTQPFQGGAYQRGPGVPLVFEHPLLGQLKSQLLRVGAQRRGLRRDRLVFLLPG